MKTSGKRTLQLGFFVILSTVILVITVYLIGQKKDIFSNTINLRVKFGNVNGLQAGNNVRLSGINVGSVLSVVIQNDSTIEVTMRIREDVRLHIKQNAIATIGTDGLMGNMLVNISPGKGDAQIVNDGDLLQTYSRIKTDDILKTLTTTNENAALLTSDLLEIVQEIKQGKGTVSYLLNDTSLRQQVFITVSNLKRATAQTNEVLSQLNQISTSVKVGNGLAGWVINDTTTQVKIKSTLEGLETASLKINSSIDNLNQMLSDLGEGEGAIPALMKDTAMANDLRITLKNLNVGSGKFSEDMEALRHHFLFRKYFRDKEKEKKKE
ncbi:MAG TPA: MlaD family protein [Cyclobacteriaceae bacterium]|nr:MlaD family protein [Cyclobacteriaceae bacterium]HRK53077.1 MlaD family protein [Cyclobacteriaceae bacterium]